MSPKHFVRKQLERPLQVNVARFPETPVRVLPVCNEPQSPEPSGLQKTPRGLMNTSRNPGPAAPAAQPHKSVQGETVPGDRPP